MKHTPIQLHCLLAITIMTLMTGCSTLPQTPPGVYQGQLAPCPTSDNCVISDHRDAAHYLPAWKIKQTPKQAKFRLMAILQQHPNIQVISHSEFYIHGQYRSSWFGFIDDLEFLIEKNAVQIRSASQLGYSDFGANKKHLLNIKNAFEKP